MGQQQQQKQTEVISVKLDCIKASKQGKKNHNLLTVLVIKFGLKKGFSL